MNTETVILRLRECRYCERYGKACGRPHTDASRKDWSRTWNGYQPTGRA